MAGYKSKPGEDGRICKIYGRSILPELLIKNRDPAAIAEGIERLLGDDRLTGDIKENQRIECKKFLWENIIDVYITVYESLVE